MPIIREIFGAIGDEVAKNFILGSCYQYALLMISFEEKPLSDVCLSCFCVRCYDYENPHGADLYHYFIKEFYQSIAMIMKIDGHIRRMDSTMIEVNICRLSQMKLIDTYIASLVKYPDKAGI